MDEHTDRENTAPTICKECGRQRWPDRGHVCVGSAQQEDTPETDDPETGYQSHYAEHEHNRELCRSLERRLNAALRRAEMLNGFREEEYKLRMKVQDKLDAALRELVIANAVNDRLRVSWREDTETERQRAERAESLLAEARAEADELRMKLEERYYLLDASTNRELRKREER